MAICLFYIVLGCITDAISMLIVTLPFVFPIAKAAGLDPIWFGILCVQLLEIGAITPPVGLNLYATVSASNGTVSMEEIVEGIVPFVALNLVILAALMVMVVFLCLGHLQLTGENIAIDMLPRRLGPRSKRVQASLSQAIALAFFATLAWQAWEMAADSWSIREYSMGLVPFPVYPGKFAVVAGAVLATLCCATRLRQILAGEDETS